MILVWITNRHNHYLCVQFADNNEGFTFRKDTLNNPRSKLTIWDNEFSMYKFLSLEDNIGIDELEGSYYTLKKTNSRWWSYDTRGIPKRVYSTLINHLEGFIL